MRLSRTRRFGGNGAVRLRAGGYVCRVLRCESVVVVGFLHLMFIDCCILHCGEYFVHNGLAYGMWFISGPWVPVDDSV